MGPNSPNPDQKIHNRDLNNFGPAVGFAWQVPWGGQGKTTVRGGYQIQYLGGGRGFVLDTAIGNPPGKPQHRELHHSLPVIRISMSSRTRQQSGLIPVQPSSCQAAGHDSCDRPTGLLNAFDPNFVSPYVQNLTLSVTRNLTSKLTLDLRYIGTLSRKMYSNIDLNAPNFLYNGLKEAFDAARRGGESTLLDDMFRGMNISGGGVVDGTT